MAINLLAMLGKFKKMADQETEDAYFRTKVPSVGPDAFLNIVYKAPPREVSDEVELDLRLPSSLSDFYRQWNGARFFVGGLSVYGCVPSGQQLDRTSPFKLLPFNIREVNREFSRQVNDAGLVCIGSYSYDRSIVCMRRESQSVVCFVGKDFSNVRREWRNLEHWLAEELLRLSLLFDEEGNRLTDKGRLLPGLEPSGIS